MFFYAPNITQEVNCTDDFLKATAIFPQAVKTVILLLLALQTLFLVVGIVMNVFSILTLRNSQTQLPDIVIPHQALSVSDILLLVFNLLDSIAHALEGMGPVPERWQYYYSSYLHPVYWAFRAAFFGIRGWQCAFISIFSLTKVHNSETARVIGSNTVIGIVSVIWIANLIMSIVVTGFFDCFVMTYIAECEDGFYIAYHAYYSKHVQETVVALSAWVIMVASGLQNILPIVLVMISYVTILCKLYVRRIYLKGFMSTNDMMVRIARQQSQKIRLTVVTMNTFLIFHIPFVLWVAIDTGIWYDAQPWVFSTLIFGTNTLCSFICVVTFPVHVAFNPQLRTDMRDYLRKCLQLNGGTRSTRRNVYMLTTVTCNRPAT